eukprot:TRINITY_DN1761_c0_g1_i1.p1 TRINITY_DN1761_c0_g1~~TRINITY_DN1761_c0_g1_i1.p1  ORF type:complete len:423 (+),score=83.55 TRINITY_DN1761_c0_g1_i1:140-1408(+)
MVRLGIMWPGVEPNQGNYNKTYLQAISSIVSSLGNGGIWTLLDIHQDIFNRKFCGEGVPDWAVETEPWAFPLPVDLPYPVDSKGYPNLTQCLSKQFAEYYLSEAVSNSFQKLYDDTNGIQTAFASMWQQIAQTFANNDNVLGYELINEPWAGDIFADPKILLPGNADTQNLFPMYQRLHNAIRQYDDDHVIFFEQALTDVLGVNGFSEGPGGKQYNDRQCYSYHIYCVPTDSQGNPSNAVVCDGIDAVMYALDDLNIQRLGCGSFMTEFGAVQNGSNSVSDIETLATVADTLFQSWSYWQYKYFADLTTAGSGESFFDEQGNLIAEKVKALSRTYAQAIAGVPVLMEFIPQNSDFTLSYYVNTSISEPTVVYLNEDWYYPNGAQVTVTGALKYNSPQKNFLNFVPSETTVNGEMVTIVISAK